MMNSPTINDKFQWVLRDIEAFNHIDEEIGKDIYEMYVLYFNQKIIDSLTKQISIDGEDGPELKDLYSEEQINFFIEFRAALYRVQKEYFNTQKEVKKEKKFHLDDFEFSTKQICQLLKITESDLKTARKYGGLKEEKHYVRKHNQNHNVRLHTKHAPLFYNLEKTCKQIYEISYDKFISPNFDLKKHQQKLDRTRALREVKRIEKLNTKKL